MTAYTINRIRYFIIIMIIGIVLNISLGSGAVNEKLDYSNIRKSTSEYLPEYKLQYSSYFGGNEDPYSAIEYGEAIATDYEGFTWVVGRSSAPDFPIVGGAINNTPFGSSLFLMKLSPDGSNILYSTFLNTYTGETIPEDMAIDHNGDIWIVGSTHASDLPTTPNAIFPTSTNVSYYPHVTDGFICRISGTDGSLEYLSYLGGDDVRIKSISISNLGYIWIAGETDSDDLPFTANALATKYRGGQTDGFICQLSSNAEILLFCSLYGGDGYDRIEDTATYKADLWITGLTTSSPGRPGFPISDNALDDTLGTTFGDSGDAFIGQINNSVRKFPSFGYCSYIGGSNNEVGRSILVDDGNKLWIIGETDSIDFPASSSCRTFLAGGRDAFLFSMSLKSDAGFVPSIENSSYFGGDEWEYVADACLDKDGSVWVTGTTDSEDLPIVDGNDRFSSVVTGDEDAFVLRMDSKLKKIQYSTYLGGVGYETPNSIAYNFLNDRIWVTGYTEPGFPLVNEYDSQLDGYTDIFVSYFSPPMPSTPPRDLSGILSLNGKILLTWGFPEDSEDSPVDHYKVYRGVNDDRKSYYADSTGLTFVDEDITTNTSYIYTVTAVNGVGESGHSNMFELAIPDIENLTALLESVPESTSATGLIFTISVIGIVVIMRRKKNKLSDL